MEYRSLSVIASEIRKDWPKPYFGAVPYLSAMSSLNSMKDMYGCDSAVCVVSYFLCNTKGWKGDTAKRIKAELKAMVAGKKVVS